MLKSIKFIFLYFVITFVFVTTTSAQNYSFLDELDKMSPAEVNVFLQDLIDEIERFDRFTNMKFVIKSAIEDTEESYEQPLAAKSSIEIKQVFNNYFSAMDFAQYFEVPNTIIQPRYDKDYEEEADKLYDKYNGFKHTSWAKKIYFHSGEIKELNEEFSKTFMLANETRQIDSILLEIKYYAPDRIIKTNLSENCLIAKNSNGFIELKAINGNMVNLLMVDIDQDIDLLKVEALNDKGKPLSSSNSNWNTLPSVEMMNFLAHSKLIYSECQRKLSQYKIGQEVKAYLLNEFDKIPIPKEERIQIFHSYTFRGNIKSVNIFFNEGYKEHTREIMLKNGNAQLLKSQFAVAKDNLTELYGLLDSNGKWIINPTFVDLKNTSLGSFYKGLLESKGSDYSLSLYKLNNETKKMELAGFNIDEFINDTLLLVQRENNGPYGIYNWVNDTMVLPMKYVDVNIKGELLTCREGECTYTTDGKYCGFTIWGHQILPPLFDRLKTDGVFFYSKTDIYNNDGIKVKP